ncbi:MAG: hypothetical protein K2X82_30445 [Gemmataceae bacterium]|nr:hypothetical protein [Gemmataceae bacterium]
MVGPGKIPKQNLPIPGRDTGTAGIKSDPLLGSPTARPGSRTGYADDPARRKGGLYVPDQGGTPAALTALPNDGDGLRVDPPTGGGEATVRPAGGTAPRDADPDADRLYADLATFGAKRADASVSRDGGQVVVTVPVPIGGLGGDGRVRGYTGTGPTEAAAVRQLLDQVKADRK